MKTKKCNHKPQIGIMPEWLWREERVADLMGAIVRITEGCAINGGLKTRSVEDLGRSTQEQKYTDELRAHLNWIYKYRKTKEK